MVITGRTQRVFTLLLTLILALSAFGCEEEVTIKEVERWDNTEQLSEKMQSFILNTEAPFQARILAARTMVLRGFAYQLNGTLPKLSNTDRLKMIYGMLAVLEEMSQPRQSETSKVRSKDAAFYFATYPMPDEVLFRYHGIMERWLDNGNYHRKSKAMGNIFPSKIIMLLAKQKPEKARSILEREFKRLLTAYVDALIACGDPTLLEPSSHGKYHKHLLRLFGDIQQLGTQLATTELDGMVAREVHAATKRLYDYAKENKQAPYIPEFARTVFDTSNPALKINEAPEVMTFAEYILKTPVFKSSKRLEMLKQAITLNYFMGAIAQLDATSERKSQLVDRAGQLCSEVMQQRTANTAYTRWKCARFLMLARKEQKAGARFKAVELVFNTLIDDPKLMHLPEDHPFSMLNEAIKEEDKGSLDPAEFLSGELDKFCRGIPEFYDGLIQGSPEERSAAKTERDRAYAFIREHLHSEETIKRITAVLCLQPFATGSRSDMARLSTLSKDETSIVSWNAGTSTLGKLAVAIAYELDPLPPEPETPLPTEGNVAPEEGKPAPGEPPILPETP